MIGACDECLARAGLIAVLAPFIERRVNASKGCAAYELLGLPDDQLCAVLGRGDGSELFDQVSCRISGPDQIRADLERNGCWSTCRHDSEFPSSLLKLGESGPGALFGRGSRRHLEGLDGPVVTIVGARRASAYGKEVAGELGRQLAGAGVIVSSGMAYGIDAAAHEGALEAGVGGSVVAVLGGAAEVASPRGQSRLYSRIARAGLILSEMAPGCRPYRWSFPARNRILAGLAGLTIVVEAAVRSGSLITATMALDSGKATGAVPGPVTSWRSGGTNALLADGAYVIRDAQDALDALFGVGVTHMCRAGPVLDQEMMGVLSAIEAGAGRCDDLSRELAIGAADAAVALGRLELLGYVTSDAAGQYSRTALQPPH